MQESRTKNIIVCQGELSVSGDSNIMLSAVLGSCVATCLWDSEHRIGGMNHILLPGETNQTKECNKFGVFAMEALINEMMKLGAQKTNLVAKVFGGAMIFDNETRIGEANSGFVRNFLDLEGIPIRGESIGGRRARRVRFYPESGKARQMLTVIPDDVNLSAPLNPTSNVESLASPRRNSGRVELF